MIPRPDPAVVALFPIVAGLLAAAPILIAAAAIPLRRRAPALVRELWLRYATWVALAGLALGALALGPWPWGALVAVLALAAFREYAGAVGLGQDVWLRAVTARSILAVHAAGWYAVARESGGLLVAVLVAAALLTFLVPIVRDRPEAMLEGVARSLLGVILFGLLLGHLGWFLARPHGGALLALLLVLVSLHDVTAFVVGRVAGRHPLRARLSPRKTREGAAGALAVVLVAAQGLGGLAPGYSRLHLLGLGLLVGAGATLGDLASSVIKRDVGVKDWGSALPGHGGVLDRLNSLVFTAPICFHYTGYILS